jgi:hypothetical protein
MHTFKSLAALLLCLAPALADTVTFYHQENCIEQVGPTQALTTGCSVSAGDHLMESVYIQYTGAPRTFKAYQSLRCNEQESFKTFTEIGQGCHSFGGWRIGTVNEV